jgi:DNA-directed RNA polymerase specialized sigma24 family protein
MMRSADQATDESLLTSGEPAAFGVFYQRHVREILGFMMRRTGNPETAADLTAETFAAAIVARRRFRPDGAAASSWLFAIAHRKLVDFQRRGYADERARRRLGLERRAVGEDDAALIGLLGESPTVRSLSALPTDQRAAIQARVLDERSYPDIAAELGTSEVAVRMRVSRGLATLRGRIRSAR